jgi:hypothetical protein
VDDSRDQVSLGDLVLVDNRCAMLALLALLLMVTPCSSSAAISTLWDMRARCNTPSNTSRVTLLAPTSLECHTDLCHPPDLARIYLVPAIIHAINQSSVPIGDLLKSLRYVGVAGAPIDLVLVDSGQEIIDLKARHDKQRVPVSDREQMCPKRYRRTSQSSNTVPLCACITAPYYLLRSAASS